MFAINDEIPSSTSLLLQCGYRSKVCTNVRATKIDGSLHKLCEFHRRKANANQQRLHERQREKRVKRRRAEAEDDRTSKKSYQSINFPLDPNAAIPIPHVAIVAPVDFGVSIDKYYPTGFFAGELASPGFVTVDMLDLQPES